ncbi:MAG: threonine--tRNA ligase, partial [Actinomycetota bacterium]
MPSLHLSDGRMIELPEGEPVGSALEDGAIAVRLGGELRDLSSVPEEDVDVEPVDPSSDEGLHVLRHSTAHVLAQAVCRLKPGAKYAIGPPIENGFYYDFELSEPLGPEDLPAIEKEMRAIAASDQPFLREELSRADALERFADQPYKREIIEGLDESEGAGAETVSVYRNDGWSDLCLGPHVPSTGRIGAFKLTSLAGAYWRGDEHRPMLQR